MLCTACIWSHAYLGHNPLKKHCVFKCWKEESTRPVWKPLRARKRRRDNVKYGEVEQWQAAQCSRLTIENVGTWWSDLRPRARSMETGRRRRRRSYDTITQRYTHRTDLMTAVSSNSYVMLVFKRRQTTCDIDCNISMLQTALSSGVVSEFATVHGTANGNGRSISNDNEAITWRYNSINTELPTWGKKTAPNYCSNNFVKPPSILISFGTHILH